MVLSDTLLAGMYHLPDCRLENLQDQESCKGYCAMIANAVTEMTEAADWCATQQAFDRLKRATGILSDPKEESRNGIYWLEFFPEYGCVVIAHRNPIQALGCVNLLVLGLDSYEFHTHSDTRQMYDFTATGTDYATLDCGLIALERLEQVRNRFRQLLGKVKERKGDQRGSSGLKQGHQYTPSLIEAVLRQSAKCPCGQGACRCAEVLPKGGFTDNGLHTGGRRRNTCFPLVRSLLAWLLIRVGEASDHLLERALLRVNICNTKDILQESTSELDENGLSGPGEGQLAKLRLRMNWAKKIVNASCLKAATLCEKDPIIALLLTDLKAVDTEILELCERFDGCEGHRYVLPDLMSTLGHASFGSPEIFIAKDTRHMETVSSEREIMLRMHENIGKMSVLKKAADTSIEELYQWVQNNAKITQHREIQGMIELERIQGFLRHWALVRKFEAVSENHVVMMETIVGRYREVSRRLEKSAKEIERRSLGVLVMWTAYCVVFNATKTLHKELVSDVGVALDRKFLEHLVLSDRDSWKWLLAVASFLKKHEVKGRSLFSPQVDAATFDVARRYSEKHLHNEWRLECQYAEERMDRRWGQVLEKKKEATRLRFEINALKSQMATAEYELSSAESRHLNCTFRRCTCNVKRSRRKVRRLRSSISSTESQLHEALRVPDSVVQPLPRIASHANRLLFFFYMPPIFRVLSRMTFHAQRALLCRALDRETTKTMHTHRGSQESWVNHFNYYASVSTYYHATSSKRATQDEVGLFGVVNIQNVKPKQIGPTSVDYCHSKEDGVWYPDSWRPRFAWRENGTECDPFVFDHQMAAEEFKLCNPLPCEDESEEQVGLEEMKTVQQRACDAPSTRCTTRGNLALASRPCKPVWMSIDNFFVFFKLRSYPCAQIRNVVNALGHGTIPLNKESVQKLIDQTLYQVGELDEGASDDFRLNWKVDIERDLASDAHPILRNVASTLRESPSNQESSQYLASIAGFFSWWNPQCKEISKDLAGALAAEALHCRRQIAQSTSEKDLVGFRTRQVTFILRAVICLLSGIIDDSDCLSVVKHIVEAKNVCLENLIQRDRRVIRTLWSHCSLLITRSCSQVIESIKRVPSTFTTAAQNVYEKTPNRLDWQTLHDDSLSCFHSRDKDGTTYAINVLTGVFLVNGLPPTSLPENILRHPLYKRVFGESNFEVVFSAEGVAKALRPVSGCFYEFSLGNGGELVVVKECGDQRMTLLDGTRDKVDQWGRGLPLRLRRMHSHWFCADQAVILIQGIEFCSTETAYLLKVENREWDESTKVRCYRVPRHKQKTNWMELLKDVDGMDMLVVPLDPVKPLLDVLEKFEAKRYIHFYRRASQCGVSFEFTRYRLSFVLDGDVVASEEIRGLTLATNQHSKGFLRGFHQYLLLHEESTGSDHLIVPHCRVVRLSPHVVKVETPRGEDSWNTELEWYRYRQHHRFKRYEATTISSRLHLAALHTATTSLVVEKTIGVTGEERAMELMRKSWSSKPYSDLEKKSLENIEELSEASLPNIRLLCWSLRKDSSRLSFLWHKADTQRDVSVGSQPTPDVLSAYSREVRLNGLNHRRRLSEVEETSVFGYVLRTKEYVLKQKDNLEPFAKSKVGSKTLGFEKQANSLSQYGRSTPSPQGSPNPFNFDVPNSRLGKEVVDELETSWRLHFSTTGSARTILDDDKIKQQASKLLSLCRSHRNDLESSILKSLQSPTCATHAFLKVGNLYPRPIIPDLVLVGYRKSHVCKLHPMIPEAAVIDIVNNVRDWMRLCIVEDKMVRVSRAKTSVGIQKELDAPFVSRDQLSCWCAFQVEGNLQVRPNQLVIARHLLDNPGDIVQLNMGEGKTRVILPLIVLYLAFECSDYEKITRLNVPSALLADVHGFFHQHISASVANLKVCTMPFRRDVVVDEVCAKAMEALVEQALNERGFMLVAPEHRLSLRLKRTELMLQGVQREEVNYLCGVELFNDFLDESDELLHTRYQLIYAMGDVAELPSLQQRSQAVQALLRSLRGDKGVRKLLLSHADMIALDKQQGNECGRFMLHRMTSAGLGDEVFCSKLARLLVASIIKRPPYALDWLTNLHTGLERSVEQFLVDSRGSIDLVSRLSKEQQQDLMALRGFIAGGLFFHCLSKRHRVEYGVARPGKKRICVPFRGADTPSLRSEFSHPDVAIGLTLLSYYYDGLSRDELKEAFSSLLQLNNNAKRKIYERWYELVKDGMSGAEAEGLSHVDKIDMTNVRQFSILVSHFSSNFETINFWLDSCVFPNEMQQYPQRLSANGWHLAEGGVRGFSGTNDTHRNLPLLVKQRFWKERGDEAEEDKEIWRRIMGTNGFMLELLLTCTIGCVELSVGKSLLNLLVEERRRNADVSCLIDAGAVLAGTENAAFAQEILQESALDYTGVLFPDHSGNWTVVERNGRVLPRSISPLSDAEPFSLYDEPRCRGSDLKLSEKAVAVLTLCPGMTKDKLMQAARRLRKLEYGQRLILVGETDVVKEIVRVGRKFSAEAVLKWVMWNTIRATEAGVVVSAQQGLFFATTSEKPEMAVEDETMTLEERYSRPIDDVVARDMVSGEEKRYVARSGGMKAQSDASRELINRIVERASKYGEHTVKAQGGADEECERELELEREVEEEREIEAAKMSPVEELDWDTSMVFTVNRPSDLSRYVKIEPLSTFLRNSVKPSIQHMRLTNRVFGTSNFFRTVKRSQGNSAVVCNNFLRLVDVVLRFPSGDVLLISEREADLLLPQFWHEVGNRQEVYLFHLDFLRSYMEGKVRHLKSNAMVLCSNKKSRRQQLRWSVLVPDDVLTELLVFSGETNYPERLEGSLERMLTVSDDENATSACHEATSIIVMRGRSILLSYSNFEKVCKRVAHNKGLRFLASEVGKAIVEEMIME